MNGDIGKRSKLQQIRAMYLPDFVQYLELRIQAPDPDTGVWDPESSLSISSSEVRVTIVSHYIHKASLKLVLSFFGSQKSETKIVVQDMKWV